MIMPSLYTDILSVSCCIQLWRSKFSWICTRTSTHEDITLRSDGFL